MDTIADSDEIAVSKRYWFLKGMAGLFSLPSAILILSFVGFTAFAAQAGIAVEHAVFMVGVIWALPAKVILVSSIAGGANLLTAFIAVTLSSIRMMPMVAALIPEIRTRRTPTWLLLFLSHFVAITAWVYSMERVPNIPRAGRVSFVLGLGMTLVSANMILVAVTYRYVADFPPIVAGCLFFLTPVYFLASIWSSSRHTVIYVALVVGLVAGPVCYWLAPDFDILLAGLGGGTIAWLVERQWRKRKAVRP